MAVVGFLHTAAGHVATFQTLLAARAPAVTDVHVVDETLLGDARRHSVDDDIRGRLGICLRDLVAQGADVIACSCSTLGGAAESLGPIDGIQVVRVDRTMAEKAVAIGGRIGVVAAVQSTLAPTRELLERCAALTDVDTVVIESPCLGAWAFFEAGDVDGYVDRLANHVRDLADQVDVVVLAQASMVPAGDLLSDLRIPVLCSPASAVAKAVELVALSG